MDTLSDQQRELIRKMSDDRLKEKLNVAGITASVIDTLARPAMLDLYSQLVATGRDKLPPATTESLPDIKLEKRRLDLEERKFVEQAKFKRLKLNKQAEQKKVQAQLESKRLDLEIERVRQQNASTESPAAVLKRYGDDLRGVFKSYAC